MDLCIDSFLLAETPGETLTFFFLCIHRSITTPDRHGMTKSHVTIGKNARQTPINPAQILDNMASFAMVFKATLASKGILP